MSRRRHAAPRRWALNPVLHFAAIGAVLLLVHDLWIGNDEPATAARQPIVISAERVHRMQADFADRWGAPPTAAQLRALVNQVVEEEILYREARVLALDFGDASVRRRLLEKARAVSRDPNRTADELLAEATDLGLDEDVVIQRLLATKMRLLLQQENAGGPIPETVIAEYRERHRDLFSQPRTVTLTHVFLRRGTGGGRTIGDAHVALTKLASLSPPAAEQLSDPFPLGSRLVAYTETQLTGRFGKSFADRVLALEPGDWAGPLESPYGLHLVRVEEQSPARLAPLEEVRHSIELALSKERAAQNLAHGLARLRELYDVRIEGGAVATDPHDRVPTS
jgi:hypothetical protein